MKHFGTTLIAAALLGATGMARADVKAGVDAWAQGDYARAVREWRPLADAGDADAQFNLGQAYKLGYGIEQDMAAALMWYGRAVEQGHHRAEDNYGLLLFQQNQQQAAMPYLQRSAARGEPRAQYLLGVALFNGDLAPRDWTRAYALMSRAVASGVAEARGALAQMDQHVTDAQRTQGLALAGEMEARDRQQKLAARLDPPIAPAAPALKAPSQSQAPSQSRAVPKPVRTAELPPSAPPAPKPSPSVSAVPPTGNWRVQLGAFSTQERAQTQWKTMSAKVKSLSGYQHHLVAGGGVTRLQAGPLASREEADRLCGEIKQAGADCIVKGM